VENPHFKQPVVTRGKPVEEASGAVILLHGRGASAEDILGVVDEIHLNDLAYLAPQAARNTWYPNSFLAPLEQNEPWLTSALELVRTVVERVSNAGISRDKIAILGFSQGACLATEFVARNPSRYTGLIAFTGGLIGPPETLFRYSPDLAGTPCFLGSGDPDPHVPWERVKESAAVLTGLGGNVRLKRYPGMPHTINSDEIAEARKILSAVVAEQA
jgi:phospholipase/carboxylesterase